MVPASKSPGPTADRAFRTGVLAAAVVALAVVGFLYWIGEFTPLLVGFTLIVLFPVYMLLAASVLSKWLGYDRDVSDLRRVRREVGEDGSDHRWGRGRP
ncbi:hypothetical protein BRC93_15250 [Halobacteriales archaeon QS_5_70_15]|nr:MAG: hypothetical protein BRC93_15250 [Halobacteriales archaeon QS_5_70_15]